MRRVSYSGEMVLKGLPLTWRQMLPALPPAEVSGSVDATALASRGLRPYLKKPELSIKQAARAVACAYGRCACGPSLRSGNAYCKGCISDGSFAFCGAISSYIGTGRHS